MNDDLFSMSLKAYTMSAINRAWINVLIRKVIPPDRFDEFKGYMLEEVRFIAEKEKNPDLRTALLDAFQEFQ